MCWAPIWPHMFGQVAQKYQTNLLSFALVCIYYHLEITNGKSLGAECTKMVYQR